MEILRGEDDARVRVNRVFQRWEADAKVSDLRGCLLVNTGGEIGPKDTTVAEVMSEATQSLVDEFTRTYQQAIDSNAIAKSPSAKMLARLTVATADGALLHSRVNGRSVETKQALTALSELIFRR